jgi:hypothetical protein
MERSIKSKQRQVLEYNVIANAAGTALTGLDANQITLTDTGTGDKLLTLPEALQNAVVQVTVATADAVPQIGTITSTTVQVLTFDATDGTTAKDAIVHVRIVGSKISEQY